MPSPNPPRPARQKNPSAPATARVRWRSAIIGLTLAVITLGVFFPVVRCDFVSYDDPHYVLRNPPVQAGLTWNSIAWAFRAAHASNWHPVTWHSHMLDTELFGNSPAGPHLVNLFLHTANTVLVFLLLQYLTGATWRSAAVAALFALHPLRVESVVWVSERKDVLCAFFGLLAVWMYALWVRNRKGQLSDDALGRLGGRNFFTSFLSSASRSA